MQTGDSEVDLIIIKATELGLSCQLTDNNKWKIDLEKNLTLLQIEIGWLLSVEGGAKLYVSNSDVLDIF